MAPPPPPPPSASASAPASKAIRLAILECDTPLDRARAKYGGYGGLHKLLLQAGVDILPSQQRPQLEISIWDVVTQQAYPGLDEIDAVLLTGSRHSAFGVDPWIIKLIDFVTTILRRQSQSGDRVESDINNALKSESHPIRIIGVCFGHQIVGRALDVPVVRSDLGWEVSNMAVDLTEKGQDIFGRDVLHIHQSHRDILATKPALENEQIFNLGTSPKCDLQGLYVPKRFITIQGHPEYNEEVLDRSSGICEEHEAFGEPFKSSHIGRSF
ncbi:MAG: hypothetical protein M1815_004423 [Lichina confinis]|nr:MAG: hypothetical protein M1815_004423 [Lichina confinis]